MLGAETLVKRPGGPQGRQRPLVRGRPDLDTGSAPGPACPTLRCRARRLSLPPRPRRHVRRSTCSCCGTSSRGGCCSTRAPPRTAPTRSTASWRGSRSTDYLRRCTQTRRVTSSRASSSKWRTRSRWSTFRRPVQPLDMDKRRSGAGRRHRAGAPAPRLLGASGREPGLVLALGFVQHAVNSAPIQVLGGGRPSRSGTAAARRGDRWTSS